MKANGQIHKTAAITGVCGYLPDFVLTNAELARLVDTSDAWITERTGIKERRILKGERDPLALFAGLDDTDALIAGDVLRALGVEVPLMGDEDGGDMVTLDDFLSMIVMACQPDAPEGLAEQLLGATRGMAAQPNVPTGMRELGRVLNAVLSGERNPDLADLPPDLAGKVRKLLEQV